MGMELFGSHRNLSEGGGGAQEKFPSQEFQLSPTRDLTSVMPCSLHNLIVVPLPHNFTPKMKSLVTPWYSLH